MDVIGKDISNLNYLQREREFDHSTYSEEKYIHQLIRNGDPMAVEVSDHLFCGQRNGHLSGDLLQDKKYLFVVETTLIARAAIDGGVEEQLAFNMGDLYVQKADRCRSEQEVEVLFHRMVGDFLDRVIQQKESRTDSKAVKKCIAYISKNLHKRIKTEELAEYVGMNVSYLSVLFKEQTGMAPSDYIRYRKIEAAKEMLRYTEFDFSTIANTLAFSSQSHFSNLIKRSTGMTPGRYRKMYYDPEEQKDSYLSIEPDRYSGNREY